ncbi:hypothetical protein ACVBEF_18100 [Glaciimonas sp. GG7]
MNFKLQTSKFLKSTCCVAVMTLATSGIANAKTWTCYIETGLLGLITLPEIQGDTVNDAMLVVKDILTLVPITGTGSSSIDVYCIPVKGS